MPRERELKFSLAERPHLSTLENGLSEAGFAAQALGTRVQNDTYFDTPERGLERAGLALRLRETRGERLVTLKIGSETAGEAGKGFHDREELELPLQNGDWPEPIRARLEGVNVDALKPRLVLRNERTCYLVFEDKTELAELSLDEVTARRPAGGDEVQFLELELEARAGSDEDLQRVAGILKHFLTLRPESLSKPRHAGALLGKIGTK